MKPRNKAILTALGVVGVVAMIVAVMGVIITLIVLFIGEWVLPALMVMCLMGLGVRTYKSAKKDFENDKTEEQ